ncbi:Methyltransferase domain-containing protein [Rubrimonas cliftonensis]|uniref:Methyltransferase domain-containing protein n=2 Tax=Rubrimonas cliftonensis TaxID=89524 RepID=A0A1H4E6Z5_9RHOB|nr:Methyltransferase domain-containing protein [Rubrimonas cliftonensis]
MKLHARTNWRSIEPVDQFPGSASHPGFIGSYVDDDFEVLGLGGGAYPTIAGDPARGVISVLADIDPAELAKAETRFDRTICVDATAPLREFVRTVGEARYDLILSHMFVEHVRDPVAVHRNCHAALPPGGRAIHAYPINNNLAMGLNSVLPERVSREILKIAQPNRDLAGRDGKFPAYYKRCHSPSARSKRYFEGLGFEVESRHVFSGHGYFARLPVLRDLERLSRRVVVALQLPLVTYGIVVLRKPTD